MKLPEQVFDANYARAYGQHDFVALSGEVVSVLSDPTWEDFYGRLESSARLGEFVLSPELITSPLGLEDIPAKQADIEGRVAEVRQLSRQRPDTTIVLGTPTFNNLSGRPANSLVFIAGGDIVAQANKSFSFYPAEKRVFTLQSAPTSRAIDRKIAGIICSDILGEGYKTEYGMTLLVEGSDEPNPGSKITADTETVLLSACWAIPLAKDVLPGAGSSTTHEDRFRWQLENRIASLFRHNPTLREVIVADRLPAGSEVEAPYNGHFTRR
jgi:hypothetical protein